MTHKLLIKFELDTESVVQGNSFTLTLNISNIGEKIFPGGTFSLFRVRFIGYGEATQRVTTDLEIPEITVENSWSLPHRFYAIINGLAWVEVKIVSNDKEAIEFHQSRRVPPDPEWSMPFYVISRESHEILSILQKILQKLDDISEKLRRQVR